MFYTVAKVKTKLFCIPNITKIHVIITESRYDDMDDSRSVRQAMEDNITCIDQMFMTDSHGHSAMDTSSVLNPIDKLYSMQNSYFSVE